MQKQKILITGVAGFIGSNLAAALLKAGHEVIGIDNLSYGPLEQVPEGVAFHKLDIRSKDIYPLFEKTDAVFHLAAKNSLPDCQRDPVETADINVAGTVNVFEASRRGGAGKIIYAESSAIYEERSLGFYALSKKACNLFANGFREAFGMKLTGLRYFNVYGPRQDYRRGVPPVMSTMIIKLLKGEPVTIFEGDERNKRDFIHVDDINAFHMLCLEDARVDNKVFDLGVGANYSILQVYETLKKILGEKIPPRMAPRLPDDPAVTTLADNAQAKSLGWTPKIGLEEGLAGMAGYLRDEIAKGNIK